jgi:hypothetical protein
LWISAKKISFGGTRWFGIDNEQGRQYETKCWPKSTFHDSVEFEANGPVKKAAELSEQVMAERERVPAEDHPGRVTSQYVLMGGEQAIGQVEAAVRGARAGGGDTGRSAGREVSFTIHM